MIYEKSPLEDESKKLKLHFDNAKENINSIRDKIIKLILLKNYFEEEFDTEKENIDKNVKKTDYLIIRFHERPIGFFVCEFNYKSARVYLRFVTIEPGFHRLGLGKKTLRKIISRYPNALGMELYTRKANKGAILFYKNYGFKAFEEFDFEKPTLDSPLKLYFPNDDAYSIENNEPNAFIAFRI